MRQKRGIGMFKDPDTLVLKGFFCKSGHCTLIVAVKENKKQDQFFLLVLRTDQHGFFKSWVSTTICKLKCGLGSPKNGG